MKEKVVVPTVLYGAVTWNMRESKRNRLDVFEMSCLKSMVWVTRMDRVRNEEVKKASGDCEKDVRKGRSEGVELVWACEECLTKRVWKTEMSGPNLRGRPRKGWMEGVERARGLRDMSMEQGRECTSDRHEWRAVVCE